MSALEHVEDNLNTFENFTPLNDDELQVVKKVSDKIRERVNNGCTGCRYCMPCPVGVNIPKNFSIWNKYGMYKNKHDISMSWNMMIKENEKAKNCIKCGKCEKVCPQKLKIRDDLSTLQKELDEVTKR